MAATSELSEFLSLLDTRVETIEKAKVVDDVQVLNSNVATLISDIESMKATIEKLHERIQAIKKKGE